MRRCRRQAGCEPESTEGRALRLRGWGGCGAAASTRSRTASDEDDEVSTACRALLLWPRGLMGCLSFGSAPRGSCVCCFLYMSIVCLSGATSWVLPVFTPGHFPKSYIQYRGPVPLHVYIKSYIRRARVSTFIA